MSINHFPISQNSWFTEFGKSKWFTDISYNFPISEIIYQYREIWKECPFVCVFILSIFLVTIVRIFVHSFIIIMKSEVWIISHCLWFGYEKVVCAVCLALFFWVVHIHRPQKVNKHQHQRGIRGKHEIGRPISREPNIVRCWNFEWFYITWHLTELHTVQNKTSKLPTRSLHNPRYNFVPVSMEVNFKVYC